jgi:hypothetical protein
MKSDETVNQEPQAQLAVAQRCTAPATLFAALADNYLFH